MLPDELLERVDSRDLAEQMAYDMLQNSEVKDRIQGQLDVERSELLSPEDRAKAIKDMLMGAAPKK